MARHTFGRTLTDWGFTVGDGNTAVLAPGASLTFWTQQSGGVQYTDLLTEAGSAVSTITTADGSGDLAPGTIPLFSGPDGVTSMWVDGGSEDWTGRLLIVANDLGSLEARVAELEATVAAQQVLLTHALYGVKYDPGVGGYPDIPDELAGQTYLIFIGPPEPTTARTRDLHIDTVE